MREATTGATGVRGFGVRIRRTSLAVKITALTALVTTAVIVAAFWALSVETRAGTRRLFADQLGRHQRALLQLQRQNLTQLISGAAIITQSPTLRSALATYRVEANLGDARRPDLVKTVERELSNLVVRVDRELLLVTDERGRVFAGAVRTGRVPPHGADLSRMAAVREVLDTRAADRGELAVYRDKDLSYQVAVYPFVLDGYTIGALLLGERLDQGVVASAHEAFEGQVVVTAGRSLFLGDPPTTDPGFVAQLLATRQPGDSTPTIRVAGDELVVAPLDLGHTQDGEPVTLWLMQPLGGTVRALTAPLLRDFLIYGAFAVLIAAIGAGLSARSVLSSFRQFVRYMRSGAASERLVERFDASGVPAEVRSLNASFQHLMRSIDAKRTQLEQRTTELTAANAVLVDEVRERQRVEHALRESEEQLRQSQKLEAIGTLAGGIAHDFNNLLAAISGFTQLALLESDPKSSVAADLRQVVEAADRAAHLTRQLLAFSRKQVLQPTVLDLAEVIEGVATMLGRLIGEHISLRTQADQDIPRVLADRGQLEQVIINLAINARDAMPQGGTITIAASKASDNRRRDGGGRKVRAGHHVVLSVSDTGTGIPDAVRERIFEPFFTTKEEGKGTGLGLSMVYGIVKQSGGTIDFETVAGGGTTFVITLPAASDTLPTGLIPERVEDDARGTETVLLVEDDADVRTLARRMLEERGYTVLPARDSLEALQLAESARIDVLLTDMVMPKVSGPELAEKIVGISPSTVVVFMSGYADDSLMSMGMSIGSAFLRKPFTLATLARTVRDAIDARKTRHASASA